MVYATFEQVSSRIARLDLDDLTPVTQNNVELFADDVSAEIDSALVALGYGVPVTEPTWFMNRLRSLCSDGAAAITLKASFPDAKGPGEQPAYAYYEKRYQNGLKQLNAGAHPKKAELGTADTYLTQNPDLDVPLNTSARQF